MAGFKVITEGSSSMERRELLALTGMSAFDLAAKTILPFPGLADGLAPKSEFSIRIAPVKLELAPGKIVETIGYNGTVPGPVLRMREGKRVTFDIRNDTNIPELVHWHGQFVPPEVDGAEEEGTPLIPPHGSRTLTFIPRPSGTRWYHTHAMAMGHLDQAAFTGQFGFLYVEPKSEPGHYDQEIFLAVHHWGPSLAHMGPPNNGWEIAYSDASINGKALGHGEPIRVRRKQRVLFRVLNASATDDIQLALPGHTFKVIAMDGNPVPTLASVEVLTMGVAERVDAIVEMNEPGIWILGSIDEQDRAKGMGIVVEYAEASGEPQWRLMAKKPREYQMDYTIFGSREKAPEPDERIALLFEKIPGQRVDFNHWTINGKQWPDTDRIRVQKGKRYRLEINNDSGDTHPLHLHRHTFEVISIGGKQTSGLMKDIVNVPHRSKAEIDFIANDPGPSLFHCHMQLHMDFGFKCLVDYI
jgi:FtsP/CotA-like multicopper oxidase with cupredoxin domain